MFSMFTLILVATCVTHVFHGIKQVQTMDDDTDVVDETPPTAVGGEKKTSAMSLNIAGKTNKVYKGLYG
jgi:hypothetical protein